MACFSQTEHNKGDKSPFFITKHNNVMYLVLELFFFVALKNQAIML
jgi:hypothetical protein